ncbi:hypothetical protein IAT40_002342 [Kwoniella sp. CBS 6097]
MTEMRSITSFLKRTYPVPEVDPTWVTQCVAALAASGTPTTLEELHLQYLHSDLAISTLESRTFPPGELHNSILFSRPTLLQIHSISEVGNSAFQIQTTMEQRSEVLSGQSRIRRIDDEEDEVEDGKVPPYPRGMLKLEVGDGRRILKAMEYKKIGDLTLGQTSLGCKLLVQNVRSLREILLLTPENTQVLESSVDHLESMQKDQFLVDLKRRMGKLEGQVPEPARRRVPAAVRPPQLNGTAAKPGSAPAPPQVKRRAASPAAQAGPSRLQQANLPPPAPLFDPNSSPPPIVRPTATRHPKLVSTSSASRRRPSGSQSPERPPSRIRQPRKSTRTAGKQASARVQQLYHDIPEPGQEDNFDDDIDVDEFDYEVDESFIRQIAEAEATASRNGMKNGQNKIGGSSQRAADVSAYDNGGDYEVYDDDDNDDDFMILDDSMIRQLDGVIANSTTSKGTHAPKQTSRYFDDQTTTKNGRSPGSKRYHDPDDDEEAQPELENEGLDDYPGGYSDYEVDEHFIRNVKEAESVVHTKGGSSSSHSRSEKYIRSSGSGSTVPRKRSSQASSTLAGGSTKRSHASADHLGSHASGGESRSSRSKKSEYQEVIEISD